MKQSRAMQNRTMATGVLLGLLALLLASPGSVVAGEAVTLFDGTSMDGWHKPMGVPEEYRGGKWEIVDGTLLGDQDPPGKGGFLATDKIYKDFVIEFDVKLDEPADSGIFLRMGEDGKNHQVTLDNDKVKKFGWVYLSWGKGTVHEAPEGLDHFKQGEWNSVKIRIEGEPSRIQVWLNGAHITDFQHTEETTRNVPKEGRIGLQIHAGDWEEGAKVRYRSIRLTEL